MSRVRRHTHDDIRAKPCGSTALGEQFAKANPDRTLAARRARHTPALAATRGLSTRTA